MGSHRRRHPGRPYRAHGVPIPEAQAQAQPQACGASARHEGPAAARNRAHQRIGGHGLKALRPLTRQKPVGLGELFQHCVLFLLLFFFFPVLVLEGEVVGVESSAAISPWARKGTALEGGRIHNAELTWSSFTQGSGAASREVGNGVGLYPGVGSEIVPGVGCGVVRILRSGEGVRDGEWVHCGRAGPGCGRNGVGGSRREGGSTFGRDKLGCGRGKVGAWGGGRSRKGVVRVGVAVSVGRLGGWERELSARSGAWVGGGDAGGVDEGMPAARGGGPHARGCGRDRGCRGVEAGLSAKEGVGAGGRGGTTGVGAETTEVRTRCRAGPGGQGPFTPRPTHHEEWGWGSG